jgi:ubiquinone/menaquinone biosynthesis C-methylase UbiE
MSKLFRGEEWVGLVGNLGGKLMTFEWGPGENAQRAACTFSAAADHYTTPAVGFWDRLGTETVRRLALSPGSAVLDVCCGAGSSALPAARAVAPTGRVLGVDVAEPLLQIARARAAAEGLHHVEFRCADATQTGLPEASFDAVVCVFGVFFAADMVAFAREMTRLTRPGGAVAVTTWGPGLFEPANGVFWEAVRAHQPELFKAYHPWDTVTSPAAVMELLVAADLAEVIVEPVASSHPLPRPEDFWDVVLGSGYRATVDALSPAGRSAVRASVVESLRASGVGSIRTDVVMGVGRRPMQ